MNQMAKDVVKYAFIFLLIYAIFGYINQILPRETIKSFTALEIILSAVIFAAIVFVLLKIKYPFSGVAK
ncbi:MAG TPA: hypothetical protein VJG83_06975 [archaeon]|nr:hypothetical protein [archaeon]